MRRLILATGFILGGVSVSLAMGGGGASGYSGATVGNVYDYLASHGCANAGFSLQNCRDQPSPPVHRHHHEALSHGKRASDGASTGSSR
jgi:hypothetical protein